MKFSPSSREEPISRLGVEEECRGALTLLVQIVSAMSLTIVRKHHNVLCGFHGNQSPML